MGCERGNEGLSSLERQTVPVCLHRTPEGRLMGSPRVVLAIGCAVVLSWTSVASYGQSAAGPAPPPSSKQSGEKAAPTSVPGLPRGKKLVLKDGSFQLVRGYSRIGERVRYLSAERNEWEEVPNSMVDWAATDKYEKDRAAGRPSPEAVALDKELEAERQADEARSPHVAPGLRLPDDGGVTHIDDLQDAIAGHRPARARIATRLAGPRVGAFWKPGDPALISLPGPAWLGAR